ncbi:hypothetical protein SCHPADRAFT_200299 [Schizopora paradoxa]|uniref:Uncharacterized protein n=1 Tax=Schizopora paradoxa TaxID=27342 RepID=A0A0H2RYG1_9AGAM|nr:hypothetical protein SCHPADRAFT_200299 [Schizopora paradoxa]
MANTAQTTPVPAGAPANSTLNPHEETRPDFALPEFAHRRKRFTDNGMTDEVAAAILIDMWDEAHEKRIEVWDAARAIPSSSSNSSSNPPAPGLGSLSGGAPNTPGVPGIPNQPPAGDQGFADRQGPRTTSLAGSEIDIDLDREPPSDTLPTLANVVLDALLHRLYIPLFYLTPEGRLLCDKLGLNGPYHVDSSSSSSSKRPAGLSLKDLRRDRDLTLPETLQAARLLLELMAQYNWGPKCIRMFFAFFDMIESHPYALQSGKDAVGPKTLTLYQDIVRKRWHDELRANPSGYDITKIKTDIMMSCHTSVMDGVFEAKLASTSPCFSVSPRRVAFGADSPTLFAPSLEPLGLHPSQNGSTISYSFVFCCATWMTTTIAKIFGHRESESKEALDKQILESGSQEGSSLTGLLKNTTTICRSPSPLNLLPVDILSRIVLPTSTRSPILWEYRSKRQKRLISAITQRTSASTGLSPPVWLACRTRRRPSIVQPSSNGRRRGNMTCSKRKNSTANYLMRAMLSRRDVRISSPSSSLCPYSVTVLVCHVPLPDLSQQTCNGGMNGSLGLSSKGPYRPQSNSLISEPTPMQARLSVWASLSMARGALGLSSPAGNPINETSLGLRPSLSKSSLDASCQTSPLLRTLRFSAITRRSSMVGNSDEVVMNKSTASSNDSMHYAKSFNLSSTFDTSRAVAIPPTGRQEDSTQRDLCSRSRTSPTKFFSTYASFRREKFFNRARNPVLLQPHYQSKVLRKQNSRKISFSTTSQENFSPINSFGSSTEAGARSNAVVQAQISHGTNKPTTPRSYFSDLTPLHSTLRPHCKAVDRLRLWRPCQTSITPFHSSSLPFGEDMQATVIRTLEASWQPSTLSTYASGLLNFHVFCDKHSVPEHLRAPCSADLIAAFISSLSGAYSALCEITSLESKRGTRYIGSVGTFPSSKLLVYSRLRIT